MLRTAVALVFILPFQQTPPAPAPVEPAPEIEESVIVEATRTNKRLEDVPTRVEILEREEIEEKMLMTPGDIVMMLNEMGGLRVQATSPSLGVAAVRVHGLPGRYTQFLVDGLPLFGQQPSGIGLLQTAPMDIGRVEVIKGVASALYGSTALAGIINLVSRRPADAHEAEVLLNQTTRDGTDGLLWMSGPMSSSLGYSLVAGAHRQARQDVDTDAWADLPSYRRISARPRLYGSTASGGSWLMTAGVTGEERTGGGAAPDGSEYVEALDTTRVDAGFSGRWPVRAITVTARASAAQASHSHRFGEVVEDDTHRTAFGELAAVGGGGRHAWVLGAAWQHDTYANPAAGAEYSHQAPAAFAQYDLALSARATISTSARLERLDTYGTAFSPRFAALYRPGAWTLRASGGVGRALPSPLIEDTETIGLSRITIDEPLEPEGGASGTIDVVRAFSRVSLGVTGFASRIVDPLEVRVRDGLLVLSNAEAPIRTRGVELLARYAHAPFAVTLSHVELHASEGGDAGREAVPLQPARSTGVVGMWEEEDRGRAGLELYYTGTQQLEDDPFRDRSPAYLIVGALVEWHVGRARLFINGENLGGTRLTRYSPFVRPSRAADGRWTIDAWAPLEGRVVNGGVRIAIR